jgi:7-keto-8-aminopelargonate synthetase-like enzyme
MDGTIAQLDKICDLADKYGALVMIDECHASGFMGKTGRGTHEHHNVMGASTSSPAPWARPWAARWAASPRAARK